MKRVISIALIVFSLKCISLYAQIAGMYYTTEIYNKYLGISASIGGLQGLSHLHIYFDGIVEEADPYGKANVDEYKVWDIVENTPIPYYVPLEEIAERIEYIYACERMLHDNQFDDYRELGPLSEGNVQLSVYTVSGNKLLFLPEGMGNKKVLINDELCELYYSEDVGGFAFYYVADFRLDEGGVPVNVIGGGADEQGIRTCMIYYYDTLVKLGDIEVTFDAKKVDMPDICIDENEYIESMVRSIQLTLAENEHYGNYEIYLGTYCRIPSEGTEESFLKNTAAKVTGCVVGEDLEQYFYFVIPDDTQKYSGPFISRAYDYYPPGYYGYEEVNERYFVGSLFMPTEEYEDCIQKIKDLGWIKISISVTEGEDYYVDINRESICEENTERTEESIDAEEALDMISYACSYSEWFGMNELGYMEGEIRGTKDKEIVIYKGSRDEDILYFIPREKVNRTVQGDNGTIYLYINTEGMAEFYAIYRNSFAEKEWHLKTTLCLTYTMDVYNACRLLSNIGGGNLKIDDLTLLEVPKVENDEYVEALENYITELLKQNGNYGEYKMYIGEYEALDYSRMCISAAVIGSEEYYFRYLIVKSQKGNYYFWPVGFGLDGSLEECEADRHYMNEVCIDRTIQLGRMEIVLDIEPSVSLLKLEEMLENNLFENVSFQQSENAIAFYETHLHTPFEGYQIPVYRETSEKDILFECTFLVEKDTGDIYIRGEKEWVLLKEGILKGLVLPDKPEDVFVYEYDGDNEVVVELLDKVFDFLKTEEEYANFKIKYDGAYSFLGRKYHSVSLIEDINDDMIHTLQRYSVDMETGDLYKESDSEERKELYYMENLGIEQEEKRAVTEGN